MTKFNNKYRIESSRWKNWDYGAVGAYFITTNAKNGSHFFGHVERDEMFTNSIGDLTNECWEAIPDHFKDVTLGEFQVMPNHFHGIIILHENHLSNDGVWNVNETPAQRRRGNAGKNTVSTMVGSFKSSASRLSRIILPEFEWQPRFHDHVIRSTEEFDRISNYIRNNPANWKTDKFYSPPPK
jgi:putative transposase